MNKYAIQSVELIFIINIQRPYGIIKMADYKGLDKRLGRIPKVF